MREFSSLETVISHSYASLPEGTDPNSAQRIKPTLNSTKSLRITPPCTFNHNKTPSHHLVSPVSIEYLVGGFNPSGKILVNWDDYSHYMGK